MAAGSAEASTQRGYIISGGDNAEQEITTVIEDCVEYEDCTTIAQSFRFLVEAQFKCSKCNFRWSSHTVTITVDMINRCISKKYRRKCKRCKNYWALPCINSDEFKSALKEIMEDFVNDTATPTLDLDYDEQSAIDDHTVEYCEKCLEFNLSCYNKRSRRHPCIMLTQRFGDPVWSSATTIFRQVPRVMASYIQEHLHLLNQRLEGMRVQTMVHIDDESAFIHILPTEIYHVIADWNKICENKLDTFLKGLDYQSLSLRPELLPKLQKIINKVKLDTSVHVEEQAVLQIAGESKEVEKTLKFVNKHLKKKPCIVPL